MEVLDTTVVNVSIPHIAGNLSATYEEGHLGRHLLPCRQRHRSSHVRMAGQLLWPPQNASLLRRRILPGLPALRSRFQPSQLIVFRVLQGLAGGGLQPLAQAILFETFPKEKHGQAMAAYGLGIIVAPIIGPTLGGWITDNYTWRWIFYLNIPVGIFSLAMMARFIHDPPYLKLQT